MTKKTSASIFKGSGMQSLKQEIKNFSNMIEEEEKDSNDDDDDDDI